MQSFEFSKSLVIIKWKLKLDLFLYPWLLKVDVSHSRGICGHLFELQDLARSMPKFESVLELVYLPRHNLHLKFHYTA